MCVYLFKCLLPYYILGCVCISLNAYYFITLLPYYYSWYSMVVCVYLFKCLLPYYLITIGGIVYSICVCVFLNAYYLITLLYTWLCVCVSL